MQGLNLTKCRVIKENLSTAHNLGAERTVLISEVSSFQGSKDVSMYKLSFGFIGMCLRKRGFLNSGIWIKNRGVSTPWGPTPEGCPHPGGLHQRGATPWGG